MDFLRSVGLFAAQQTQLEQVTSMMGPCMIARP